MVAGLQLYKKTDKEVLVEKLHSSIPSVSEAIFDIHHPPSPPLILNFSRYQSGL